VKEVNVQPGTQYQPKPWEPLMW